MAKAPEAFRTISEAADLLDTPAHVLRFWESKFPQIKPVKRAGGRRYYRRVDIDLLSGIKLLLHDQGMTIRGVQKLLQDRGPRHVAELSPLADGVMDPGVAGVDAANDVIDAVADIGAARVADPAPALPDPAPAPLLPDGEANVFAHIRAPIVLPPLTASQSITPPAPRIQPARLAHALRSVPQALALTDQLARITDRLEALVARMQSSESNEHAR